VSISYLTALLPEMETPIRKALMWIGGLTLIPLAAIAPFASTPVPGRQPPLPESRYGDGTIIGWSKRTRRLSWPSQPQIVSARGCETTNGSRLGAACSFQ